MTLARDKILLKLTEKLYGPGLGEKDDENTYIREKVEGRLNLYYMTGLLYPPESEVETKVSDDVRDGDDNDEHLLEDPDDPLNSASELMPSSLGFTICVMPEENISINISAARYFLEDKINDKKSDVEHKSILREGTVRFENAASDPVENKEDQREIWVREPYNSERILITSSSQKFEPYVIFDGAAKIDILNRKTKDKSRLLTISLINTLPSSSSRKARTENTLFQVKLTAEMLNDSSFLRYPEQIDYMPTENDERELRLIYGKKRPFAIGHGVSADWSVDENGKCDRVKASFLPLANVWQPLFDELEGVENNEIFSIRRLASSSFKKGQFLTEARELNSKYQDWISNLKVQQVEVGYEKEKDRIINKCSVSSSRIGKGINLLEDDNLFEIFQLANQVMLMNLAHAKQINSGPFELGEANTDEIDYFQTLGAWRPFQLCFFLQVLPSLVDENHDERDLVDVIWFPTGGGKTEAYLFLSAFELIKRRYFDKEKGGGVGVINRYTYRFLSMDQFQRTSIMICALELLRRKQIEKGNTKLGETPFSIGLFVGGDISPNKFSSQYSGEETSDTLLSKLTEAEKMPRKNNKFPIGVCPCCGTYLVPETQKVTSSGATDYSFYGFTGSGKAFKTFCPEESCHFHERLPVHFIDQDIIEKQPSFLLGTIDKFAMIPWNENNGKLLGANTKNNPPSLIIQDELHLISGPLGTIASLYEAAFDLIMRKKFDDKGPKYIASSATIRNTSSQIERMYGRKAAIFPSPGLSDEDSFFTKLAVSETDKSRLYLGVMGQGLTSSVAVIWVISAILQTAYELGEKGDFTQEEINSYWTLLAYHNSKRELGRISNAVNDEINARISEYATDTLPRVHDRALEKIELTSNSEDPIPIARQKLSQDHTIETPASDVVPCTNIISVGVDISRLALMLVNGQPKLSSEYIQATSRVGRGKVKGLVLTCFSPTKPRDRSHFESFRHFHESFYSFVEPTSVTPASFPAIERALHACLITVIRHVTSLSSNQDAKKFDPQSIEVKERLAQITKRLHKSYPDNNVMKKRIDAKLREIVDKWSDLAKNAQNNKSMLLYQLGNNQSTKGIPLMIRYDEKSKRAKNQYGWVTLQSMRNVDKELKLGL